MSSHEGNVRGMSEFSQECRRPMPTIEAVKFEQWVNDNNPDHNLSYSKGWWDTVEFIYFLKEQLEIEDVSVVGTFTLRTPPPTEELLSPIVCLKTEDFTAFLKEDFGDPLVWWTMSLHAHRDLGTLDLSPFLSHHKPQENHLGDFSPSWVHPSYQPSAQSFTARLEHNYDVYGVLRQICRSPRWKDGIGLRSERSDITP